MTGEGGGISDKKWSVPNGKPPFYKEWISLVFETLKTKKKSLRHFRFDIGLLKHTTCIWSVWEIDEKLTLELVDIFGSSIYSYVRDRFCYENAYFKLRMHTKKYLIWG